MLHCRKPIFSHSAVCTKFEWPHGRKLQKGNEQPGVCFAYLPVVKKVTRFCLVQPD